MKYQTNTSHSNSKTSGLKFLFILQTFSVYIKKLTYKQAYPGERFILCFGEQSPPRVLFTGTSAALGIQRLSSAAEHRVILIISTLQLLPPTIT